jgi:hypothetical protein
MAGFYIGAVGDSLRAIGIAMLTEAEPQDQVEEAPEPTGRCDVYETAAEADFALVSRMSMIPCGCCDCPGCYDCTPGTDGPCGCLPDDGIDLSSEVAA